ncbi:hypothetical protein DL766_007167 [Monosporascus sp. MC13-8B]|nr:hypothetical protein DL763_000933 [Monosporascus cannonballus]RYP25074.1 hypothetical protein DL766_007167 [Monosporascus sp. MC13-8B]
MATRLPSALPRRPSVAYSLSSTPLPSTTITHTTPFSRTPSRSATIIRRPRRPYTFTQLVQLSDGSTYTMRTTSPHALYRSTKDTRNHVLWQPNESSLRNVEVDEAGKLAAFRGRFGRGWDAEGNVEAAEGGEEGGTGGEGRQQQKKGDGATGIDALGDLISGYSRPEDVIKEKEPVFRKKK